MPKGKSIASLYVDLLLESGDLTANVKEATRKLGAGLSKYGNAELQGAIKSLQKQSKFDLGKHIVAGVGSLIALNKLKETIKETSQDLRELNQNAQALHMPVDQFQTLDIAAKQSGVNTEQLTAGIQNMQQVISEANLGNRDDRSLLQSLGLDPQTLAGESAGQQFRDVADGLSKVGNAADRSSDSIQLFSYYAGNLINVASRGSGELDKLAEQLSEKGVLITPQESQNFAKFNDQMTAFGSILQQEMDKSLAKFADDLESSDDKMKAFDDILNKTETVVKDVADGVSDLATALSNISLGPISKLADYFGSIKKDMDDQHMKEWIKLQKRHPGQSFVPEDNTVANPLANTYFFRKSREFAADAYQKQRGAVDQSMSKVRYQSLDRQNFSNLTADTNKAGESARAAQSDYAGLFDSINDELNQNLKTWQDWASFGLKQLDNLVNEINNKAVPAVDNLNDSTSALTKAGGSILGALFGGGGAGGASFAGLAGAFGGSFADGGVAPAGKISLVGERGPEFIAPRSSMVVTPAKNMVGAGGGGAMPVIHQTFTGGVSHSQLREEAANIKRQTMQAVLDASRRGGNYRRGLHQ